MPDETGQDLNSFPLGELEETTRTPSYYMYEDYPAGLDWIEQCFTSPPTQYRLYGRRFLQFKRPNQQYQSTEGPEIE